MKPPNWDRLEEIYHAALALPVDEREAFVTNQCAGDPELLEQVKSLLETDEDLMSDPVFNCPSLADSLVGKTIDRRYVIQRELVGGGMARVYVANDLQLPGRLVVIKVLPQTATEDPDAVRRVKREIQALTAIEHPNVVSVLGAGEVAPGKPYIAMQYIDGVTLRSLIAGGMQATRAASLLKDIGAALRHIHSQGVLHCDLKPANIMIQVLGDGSEVVKILDFGIAKLRDPAATSSVNTVAIGTRDYMSPEQLREGERITAASDVYSMAVVACEMITGKRPPPASQGRHINSGDLPSELSGNVRRVLIKALSVEPLDRYQDAKEFGDALAKALLDDVWVGPAPPLRERLWAKALAVVGVTLILALASYGIYKYVSRPAVLEPNKSFKYWLMVQEPGKEPYKSNGKDTFANGDKFQLNISTTASGYLYVFNEGPPEPETSSLKMIYPNRETNNSSASVGANQTVQSDWMTFHGPTGAENFWIVWSESPVAELETATAIASNNRQQGFVGNQLVSVKESLKALEDKVKSKIMRYEETQSATVRGRTDILVAKVQFKHR